MPLIHMVIADRDVEYVQRLTQWFRENKSQQFQISAFTEEESFNRYLLTCDSDVDVFLIEEKFVNAELTQKGNFIILGNRYPIFHQYKNIKQHPQCARQSYLLCHSGTTSQNGKVRAKAILWFAFLRKPS